MLHDNEPHMIVPIEIIGEIISYCGCGYVPLLRSVCRTWAQHCRGAGPATSLTTLVKSGRRNILQWVYDMRNRQNQTGHAWLKEVCNKFMCLAAENGHISLVEQCYTNWGADDINNAMCFAAYNGHEHIVRQCRNEWGATNAQAAMIIAGWRGHLHIVKLCREEWNDCIYNNTIRPITNMLGSSKLNG